MAVSKSQQKAVHKYVKANYDRMELTVPKGRKDAIKAAAAAAGESVNAYINGAIDARMGAEGLPEAAAAAQAQLDQTSLKLGINPATRGKLEKEA